MLSPLSTLLLHAHCNTLQHTDVRKTLTRATHCNTMQPTQTHCNRRANSQMAQETQRSSRSTKQLHPQAHCNTLQHTNVRGDTDSWDTLQHKSTHCNTQMVRKTQGKFRQFIAFVSVEQLLWITDYICICRSCNSDDIYTHSSCPASIWLTKWIQIWLNWAMTWVELIHNGYIKSIIWTPLIDIAFITL